MGKVASREHVRPKPCLPSTPLIHRRRRVDGSELATELVTIPWVHFDSFTNMSILFRQPLSRLASKCTKNTHLILLRASGSSASSPLRSLSLSHCPSPSVSHPNKNNSFFARHPDFISNQVALCLDQVVLRRDATPNARCAEPQLGRSLSSRSLPCSLKLRVCSVARSLGCLVARWVGRFLAYFLYLSADSVAGWLSRSGRSGTVLPTSARALTLDVSQELSAEEERFLRGRMTKCHPLE